MKKWLTLLLVLAMVASLGVGFAEDTSNEFVALAWGDSHIDNYKKQEAEFNEMHPEYKFTFDQDSSEAEFLVTRAAANDLPDLFYLSPWVSITNWASGDWLYDLTDEAWVAELSDGIRDSISVDGVVHGFPYSVCYTGFFYNKDIFEKFNLEVPTTVSEFRAVCETLQANGVTPIAVGGGGGTAWAYHQYFESLFGTAAGDMLEDVVVGLDEGTMTYKDIPNYEGVKEMYEMTIREFNLPNPMDVDYSAMMTAFAEGEVAMYHNGSWSVGDAMKIDPNMRIGFFGYPVNENPEDTLATWETEIVLAMAKDTDCASGCKAFLEYLSKEGAQNTASLQGRVPAFPCEMPRELVSDTYEEAMELVNAGKVNSWLNWRVPVGFEAALYGDLQNYAIGEISFDELCDIASEKWTSYHQENA